MTVMYGIYNAVNVNVGKILFESFLSVCEARRNKIVCHHYWSVIVEDTLEAYNKENPEYVIPAHYSNMQILVDKIPSPKRSGVVFKHPGHIPQSTTLRIPSDNLVRKAYDKKQIVMKRCVVVPLVEGKGKKPVEAEAEAEQEAPQDETKVVEKRKKNKKKSKSKTFSKSKFADEGNASCKSKRSEDVGASKKKKKRLVLNSRQPKHVVMVSSPEYETDPDGEEEEEDVRTHVSNSQGGYEDDDVQYNDDASFAHGNSGDDRGNDETEPGNNDGNNDAEVQTNIEGEENVERMEEEKQEGPSNPNASKAGGADDQAQVKKI